MNYENPPGFGQYPEPPSPGPGLNKWVIPGVIGVLILGMAIGCAGRGESAAPAPAPAVTVTETALPEPAPTVTVTQTALPEPAPTATETTPPEPTPVEPTEDLSAEEEEEEEEETFKMPKIVGMTLQDAQDKLQSLDSFVMDQEDASGLDRWQIDDSNWKVCSQKPKAGKVVPISTIVTARAVKLKERCP